MTLYEPLDFFTLRAPLLPIETFDALGTGDLAGLLSDEVRAALAVGSLTFAAAVDGAGAGRTLRRYLIRMSTRPTPFGLFAGTGVGGWGGRTDLQLAPGPRPRRTRPDAAWLLAFVDRAESAPAVRRRLHVVADTSAFVRAGRVVLGERVSIRATGVVLRALAAARSPIPYSELACRLLRDTPGATEEKVETLLAQLCQLRVLMTDLRPPLTVADPAGHVLDRLEAIPEAGELAAALRTVVAATRAWDAAPVATEAGLRAIVAGMPSVAPFDRSPLQVDAGVALRRATVSDLVASEAARAGELLLRMSPMPHGPSRLATYRRMFEHRYGPHREVPLLELLDPNVGLGPPPASSSAGGHAPPQRAQALLALATAALRDRSLCIDLDDATVRQLETGELSPATAPLSLELAVQVAARSQEAIDAGDFQFVVGPNVGSASAGRMLGRFADFVPGATPALRRVAEREADLVPGRVMAELAYAPRSIRMANVSTRPNVRGHEIAAGVPPGADTIPVDELVVGVRDGRFLIRWTSTGEEVVVCAGHMLNSTRAPALSRFLSDVGRDGVCQLSGFQWGPAAGFPFLPRVRSGRAVLSLAQWRVAPGTFPPDVVADPSAFGVALDGWRRRWDAPARLAITAGDHRLPLDLGRAGDVDELRHTVRGARGPVVVTEVFPDVGDTWVTGAGGRRFATELVVPLVRRVASPIPPVRRRAPSTVDLRAPGSDWLFVKLYTGRDMEDDLLAGPVRRLTAEAAALGFGTWFFIRYSDPGRHIRLRFHGDPERLLAVLLPHVAGWAAERVAAGEVLRVAFDTYEREVDRFGGPDGLIAAEAMFAADSAAVVELLARRQAEPFALAVRSVDALLDGLGLDSAARAEWCGKRGGPRHESGADYRTWKARLRPLLADPPADDPVTAVLHRLRAAGATLRTTLEDLHARGSLTGAPSDLYGSVVHLHLNRLLAADTTTERRVLGLLGRLHAGLAAGRR